MATYQQWYSSGKVKRVTWVCGPEQVLVREVEAAFRCEVQSAGVFYATDLTAAAVPEAAVWDAIAEVPAYGDRHQIIVREAQLLDRMTNAVWLAGSPLKNVWVLFISADEFYDRKLPRERGGGRELFPGPAAVQALSCGQVVKCVINDEDKVAWVQRRLGNCPAAMAQSLLGRLGNRLDLAADVCTKVAAARQPVTWEQLDFLSDGLWTAETFEDNLIHDRKREALLVLPAAGEFGKTVALLSSRLDTLATLYAHSAEDARELCRRVPYLLVSKYRVVARHYHPQRITDCRTVLATLDGAWRHGARTGLAEALVAMW